MQPLYDLNGWEQWSDEERIWRIMELIRLGKASPNYLTDLDLQAKIAELEEKLDQAHEVWTIPPVDDLINEIQTRQLLERVDINYHLMREKLVEIILNQPADATVYKNLALQFIQIEKDNGMYDPDNWKGVDNT